ncbi:hypothetical protein DPMN_165038 [Dreissena polymorpha]|uniref:Uncharacterized protein n=1 Tax=Dreissena polymorpha TaxID=45954 RepID=A0A9D4IU88_DREPO|nr:hypothetical protein DPMN_165038 [Dreissena polymorpha]
MTNIPMEKSLLYKSAQRATSAPEIITDEALKADVETRVEIPYKLFSKIWKDKEIPTVWTEVYLIELPMNLSSCSHSCNREITRLSILEKVLYRIPLN